MILIGVAHLVLPVVAARLEDQGASTTVFHAETGNKAAH